jgi:hypothetical protein
MEKDDLIRKLEGLSTPDIEISAHKQRLKALLLAKYYPEKKRMVLFSLFKKLVPLGALAIIGLAFLVHNFAFPRYTPVQAQEIALQNPEIQDWISKGATMQDIEIIDGKAYILIQPQEKEAATNEEEIPAPAVAKDQTINQMTEGKTRAEESFKGAFAEIDIKEKRISKVEELASSIERLTDSKRIKTEEIARRNPEIPKEAEILDVQVSTPKFRLVKKDGSVQVSIESEENEKASIIYEFDKKQWEGKINLEKGEVEEIKFLGEAEDGATSGE